MQTIAFHILLNGSLKDLLRVKDMLYSSMDTEFHWLRVTFQKLLPYFKSLGFKWEGLGYTHKSMIGTQNELDTLSNIIRSKFADLHRQGQLTFQQSYSDVWPDRPWYVPPQYVLR